MIPAMKRVVAEVSEHPEWRVVRPPLVPLDEATAPTLLSALKTANFEMTAYPGVPA
jgi:hypothetical protein